MSYLTFKIISLAVLVIILIVVIVKKKSGNISEKNQEVTKTNEHPKGEVVTQDKVDYKAIHDEMYYVEYKLIPHFVEMFKDQPGKSSQIVLTIYENLVTLQNHLRKVNPHAFGNISCEVCGDIENECLAVYEFPKPFNMPLAKYGAVYFNQLQQKYKYWTLELTMNGNYVLGSKSTEGHANYGQRANLSKEEFIHEVCQLLEVDEIVLQPRNMISRKYMHELSDSNFKNTIANSSLLVVCFYDFNQPSQRMIPVLDQLAQEYEGQIMVGIYDVYGGSDNLVSAEKYSISALPTFLFFADGVVVDKHIGVCATGYLKEKIENLLIHDTKARPVKP